MEQMRPRDERARFEYLEWNELYTTEKPYEIFIDLPDNMKDTARTNLKFAATDPHNVEDMRAAQTPFDLDTHGFTWVKHETKVRDLKREDSIAQEYIPEMEALLKQHVAGADKVFFFDWRLRLTMSDKDFANRSIDLNHRMDPLRPSRYPHVDQSPDGARTRCYYHLKHEAEELLKGRFRIINLWRPLHRIKQWPLAVCDARSVPPSDLLTSDFVRRKYSGEVYWVLHNPDHRWYYLSDQGHDEVMLLKIYDSSRDVEAKFCVHSSFPSDAYPVDDLRESLEMRAMVFTYTNQYRLPPTPLPNLSLMPTLLVKRRVRQQQVQRLQSLISEVKVRGKATEPREDKKVERSVQSQEDVFRVTLISEEGDSSCEERRSDES